MNKGKSEKGKTSLQQKNTEFQFPNDETYKLIPIERLKHLKTELSLFKKNEAINKFQGWILDNFYNLELPKTSFAIKSILIIAIPHPFFTDVVICHKGKRHQCLSPVLSDFEKTETALVSLSKSHSFEITEAKNLPLKRLAVQSGFAVYGKNNITYIDGLGSNFSYAAYFTDLHCNDSTWVGVNHPSICDTCTICIKNCPTGAIGNDRFLINNEICLSYMNESGEPFPEWLPKSVHHTLYDCLKCQITCPMNKNQYEKRGAQIEFDEDETNLLLSETHFENYPEPMQKKAKYLGLNKWPDGIAKNLKTLIEFKTDQAFLKTFQETN